MRIPHAVTQSVDHAGVVQEELCAKNRFLPPRWGDLALASHLDEVSSWFRSVARRDIAAGQSDVVMARKYGRGARPLHYMTLRDRLCFRAAISVAMEDVNRPDRGDGAYEAFLEAPLSSEGARFILKADIAAFYQYIDHEKLVDEVVAQTGDELAATFAMELMQEATGRRFGLPQMTEPSDRLAELYIAPVERALTRRGFTAFRFADDFRVSCRNYNQALAALELIERTALELGLVLNESKTTTPGVQAYRQSLKEIRQAEAELFASIDADVDAFDVEVGYDEAEAGEFDPTNVTLVSEGAGTAEDEVDPGDDDSEEELPDEIQLRAARLAVDIWLDDGEESGVGQEWNSKTRSIILRKALKALSRGEESYALPYVTSIIVHEPHLAPQLCAYMRALVSSDRRSMVGALDRVCNRRAVSVWQSLWLAFCAGNLPQNRGDGRGDHVNWLRRQLDSEHHSLAAEAALALARRKLITSEDLMRVILRIPPAHKSTVVMALSALGGDQTPESAGDDRIERLQAEWAAERWA